MRFHTKFSRRVGAVSDDPVLGSDSAPTAAADATRDNGASLRLRDHRGFAVTRIVVGYSYTGAGPAKDLPASLYVRDELSERWFLASSGTLKPGQLAYLAAPGVQPGLDSAVPGAAGAGPGFEAVLVVSAAGGDPDGRYLFALAACA